MEDNLNLYQIEDDLNILANGRQPPHPPLHGIFSKWKTTLKFWQMEDNHLPHPPSRDDAFLNLTEGWLSSSKIFQFNFSLVILHIHKQEN